MTKQIIFFSRLHDPHLGGVEKFMKNTIYNLNKNNCVISLITEQYDYKLLEYEDKKDYKIYRIPTFNINEHAKKFIIWKWLRDHKELISNSDIIHINDVYFWVFSWKLTPNNWHRKTYLTFHGWETKYPIPWKNIVVRKISEKMANGNICIGDFIAKWYHTKPDIVSYGGVNPPQYPITDKNILFYSGRLAHDTGFDECAQLYEHLKHKFRWKLVVAGDGPYRQYAPPSANMLGFVPDPEKYLANCRFAFATGYLAILEAMIYRKLVISTYDNPVKKDYLQLHPMSANMVIGENWREVSDKIQALTPGKIDAMIESAYLWAKEQTWEKFARQHLQLWSRF